MPSLNIFSFTKQFCKPICSHSVKIPCIIPLTNTKPFNTMLLNIRVIMHKKYQHLLLILCSLFLYSCASPESGIKKIQSANHNDRIRYLVIHHTTIDYEKSLSVLTKPRSVSAHYLIPEGRDPSYTADKLEAVQLVDEKNRAWHAGRSHWQGQNNLNDQSIGIELVYLSPCGKSNQPIEHHTGLNSNALSDRICFYPDFDQQQIAVLIDLIKGILERNPEISATRIVGHADITPDRRIDPGPRFPWQRLYKAGIGAWYEEETVTQYWNQFLENKPSIGIIQAALRSYGYGIIETGILDAPTINALSVFQMHFRPWEVTGTITPQTSATLFALLDRYFPKKLKQLQIRLNNEITQKSIEPKLNFQGQFNGLFPELDPSTRKLVNGRKMFKAYKGKGSLNILSNGATSADIYINGKKLLQKFPLSKNKESIIDLSNYTKDGYNSFKVNNIRPSNSSVVINIPFPSLTNAKPSDVGFSEKKLQKIDQLITKDIKNGFPGATLLIAKNGKIIKNTSYGFSRRYKEDGSEVLIPSRAEINTLYDVASNTKMYATNYALMKLVSEKKLDITAPINRYIAEYRGEGRDSRTVKDLLTHSAGYAPSIHFYSKKNSLGSNFYSQDKKNTQYLLTQRVPFVMGRGIKAIYSDTDYMLLGTLIERITGQDLDVYVEEEIFKPLGLSHTLFNPLQKGFEKKHIAATELMGNSRDGQISFNNIRTSTVHGEVQDEKAFYSMGGVAGHAGLFSTTSDLATLASVMLNRGGVGDVKLFDKSVIDQFLKPSDLNVTIGLGWRRAANGERIWQYGPYASPYAYGHTGWTGTVTIIDPFYDLIIVLLTNKKHTKLVDANDGNGVRSTFLGDTFETGKYGSIVSLVYEAFLEN